MAKLNSISGSSVNKVTIGVFVLLFACIAGISFCLKFVNEQTNRHTIMSIDKVENRSGDKDGFTTEIYYIVTTDKGIYHIETKGWNAHPECAGMKKDSTYLLTTRGFNFPFMGMYPSVISYQTVSN